jgi:hypothetical protein
MPVVLTFSLLAVYVEFYIKQGYFLMGLRVPAKRPLQRKRA